MAKVFDVYLNRRVTECDLFINSLQYRDTLSVYDRLIINSVLQSYLLQKFIAVRTGSVLTAHIDEMIKRCYELLRAGVKLDAEASFSAVKPADIEASTIELSTEDVSLLAQSFTDAEDAIILAAEPLLVSLAHSFSEMRSGIVLSAEAELAQWKHLRTDSGILLAADELETKKASYLAADLGLSVNAELVGLCRRVYNVGTSAIGIAQILLGTELHYSLGRGENIINIGARVTGTTAEKFVAMASALRITAEATEKLYRYIDAASAVELSSAASAVLRRPRRLNEVDDLTLDDIDDLTLDELYYVTLS
jgi:hypothetical protein